MTTPLSDENRLILTASILADLSEHWTPHPTQKKVLKALFKDDVRHIYCECGRKWGKSETISYIIVRWMLLNPGSACYYVAPLAKQAKEIIWVNRRIINMIPKKYIKNINNTEMRVTLTNGSFFKADGSENYESYRGITPDLVCLDEIKDFHAGFFEAMVPNLAVKNAPMIIIGTPPEVEGLATDLRDEYKKSKNKQYFNFPSVCNPYISKEWLDAEKASLFEKGEEDVWYREYEAKFVRGGKNSVFPMLKDEHFITEYNFVQSTKKDKSKLRWVVSADPGSTTCFAVLFICLNTHTKEAWVVDEIYETNPERTTTDQIWSRIKLIKSKWTGPMKQWTQIYDEAASWFYNELVGIQAARGWNKTTKAANRAKSSSQEPPGLSLIKDMLLKNKLYILEGCQYLRWEMFNYVKVVTRAGERRLPKKDDHAIDCLRYGLLGSHYTLTEKVEIETEKPDFPKRETPEDYLNSLNPYRRLWQKYGYRKKG